MINHYIITIQYDGAAHNGWQRLKSQPNTVQQIVEDTLSELLKEPIKISGSGRTDSGVHAVCQYADFFCNKKFSAKELDEFPYAVNSILPGSIAVTSITHTDKNFHSRKSCTGKTYAYCVSLDLKPDVFIRKYLYCPSDTPLRLSEKTSFNMEAMKNAADFLCGTHDFSAFTSDKSKEKSFVRTIREIKIYEKAVNQRKILIMEFTGDGFLYNMVRILSGTLLWAGLGKIKSENIPDIIMKGDRALAGPTLPPNGLFLVKPYYNE